MATWTSLGVRSVRSVQSLTEAAPVSVTDGLNLADVGAILPVLKAPNGQTFTGGAVRGYMYVNSALGGSRWVRCPRADDDLADLAGISEAALPVLLVTSPSGGFALLCDGVTLSGAGTQVTIDLYASARGARGEAL